MNFDPEYMKDELSDYPEFRAWLNDTQPDWQHEYSAHILTQLDAYKFGKECLLDLESSGEVKVKQTSGPRCLRCGNFTTYTRVRKHGMCMRCELHK